MDVNSVIKALMGAQAPVDPYASQGMQNPFVTKSGHSIGEQGARDVGNMTLKNLGPYWTNYLGRGQQPGLMNMYDSTRSVTQGMGSNPTRPWE